MVNLLGDKCCGCYACYNACPQRCIKMSYRNDGFVYPIIDIDKCISCNLCIKKCPVLNRPGEYKEKQAYAAYNQVSDRISNSSGGIYAALAESIIDNKGIVYGAAFDEGFQSTSHIRACDADTLKKTYTSKYMQSHIKDIYTQVKNDLRAEKRVLFSGTPCQVAGLRSYLGEEYENLICVDFICHGVPSEKIWKLYTDSIMSKYHSNIDEANFRYKEKGWNPTLLLLLLLGDNKIVENQTDNIYYQGFLSDLCLRKSCYECSFKSINGYSDITLADFWGIDGICPELNDNKGTNLVILNSLKEKSLFSEIENKIRKQEVDYIKSISKNPARIRSADRNFRREAYFERVNAENLYELTIKYTTQNLDVWLYKFYLKVYRKMNRLFKKVLKGNYINDKI